MERYILSKADWGIWKECTEEKFKAWNEANIQWDSVDQMADSFMDVYTECLVKAVPKKEIKSQHRRKKPPWWNEDVARARSALNAAKKTYKRRRTPNNFECLKEKECELEKVSVLAKESWTEVVCDKISCANSAKEMWENFRVLTSYQDNGKGGVLPLFDENKRPAFSREDKCFILQNTFFGGKHLESCDFDEEFKTHVEEKVGDKHADFSTIDIGEEDKERAQNYLNYDITIEETEAVLQRLQNGKSPGPDNIFTDMLKNAGEEMTKAIHNLFQMSWETSKVPDKWKEAEVKFLRKSGKKSYHDASAYRPISLTSCLCKCLERLITHRLYGFVEHFGLLDDEQEGFRRFRGTTDALLRLTQNIFNGFNQKEHTAALFIDLEKAYDSVWREGLMFKLRKLGLTGRVWKWINSFLTSRHALISMGGKKGTCFATNIGLPQGSVLAPLLFNLFIRDMFDGINCQCVKFADDGTIWKKGSNVTEILSLLKTDLKVLLQWAKKWRMKISLSKTEFCVFSLDVDVIDQAREYNFTVDDKKIMYNKTPKILGVTLDEKMKFESHIDNVEKKAFRSLDLLRKVKETESISPKCMLHLYKALVAPQLEYAATVWQVGNCDPLEKIQRKGLAMCLEIYSTAGIEALEVESGIRPLEIRREELSIRQATKILMKDNSSNIKSAWNEWIQDEKIEHRLSPFGKMNIQLADMTSNTGLALHNLEQELNFLDSLQPSKKKPEYWLTLGSSKSRTTEQERSSRNLLTDIIGSCSTDTTVCFTDGSCLGNPGPCGAGACIFLPGAEEPVCLKKPVSSCGSILLGELVAIQMAIENIYNSVINRGNITTKLHVFSDSQSAIGILSLGWEATSHKTTVKQVKHSIFKLKQSGVDLEISWTPGHADIRGNELADKLAKEAAEEAKEMDDSSVVVTMEDVKSATKKFGIKKWQDMWEKPERGRTLYIHRPEVNFILKHSFKTTKGEKAISQLRTG